LRQALHSDQTPILIGGRGMGKTSVLWQVPFHLEARYLSVYLDLAEPQVTESLTAFISALIDSARQALRLAEPSLYLPDLPAERDAAALWLWFTQTHLTPIFDVMRRFQRLIYCFDNAQHLLSAVQNGNLPSDFIESLAILDRDEPRIGMIFAFDADCEPQLAEHALFNEPLNQQRLLPLSDEEATQLIVQLSAPFYVLSAEVIEMLLAQSGGQPYLLQWLCALLWEAAAARNFATPPNLDDMNAILPVALQACSALFEHLWRSTTPNEQAVLAALAELITARRGLPIALEELHAWLIRESENAPHMMTLAAALRSLEYRGIVRAVPRSAYTFSSGLFYLWLQPQAELPQAPEPLERTAVRRAALPIVLAAFGTLGVALLIALLARSVPLSAATPMPTQTLALNLEATQRARALTQTFQALPTATLTATATATATLTFTATPTATLTATATATATLTFTATPTATATITPSFTATRTLIATLTPSATLTASRTPSTTAVPPLPTLPSSATPLP
jgi:hypothetical protein